MRATAVNISLRVNLMKVATCIQIAYLSITRRGLYYTQTKESLSVNTILRARLFLNIHCVCVYAYKLFVVRAPLMEL